MVVGSGVSLRTQTVVQSVDVSSGVPADTLNVKQVSASTPKKVVAKLSIIVVKQVLHQLSKQKFHTSKEALVQPAKEPTRQISAKKAKSFATMAVFFAAQEHAIQIEKKVKSSL